MQHTHTQPFPELKRLGLLAVCAWLTGCMSAGPDYVAPNLAPPVGWLESSGTQTVGSVLQAFDSDPTLQSLLRNALANNPDLKMAMARLQKARALQGVQDAATGPNLSFQAKTVHDQLSQNAEMFANMPPKQTVKSKFTNTQLGVDASWELDFWGYQQRLSQAAQARTESMGEKVVATHLSLTAEVLRNYFELRTWQQRLALARRQLQVFDAQIVIQVKAFDLGEISSQEVQRVQTARAAAAALIPNLELSERQSLAALSVLSTLSMGALQTELTRTHALPDVPKAPAAGIPAALLQRRPDLRSAERELAAASADVGVATAAQYPRITLSGNAGWSSIYSSSVITGDSKFWSVGPGIYLPLFTAGRLKNQLKANQAALDEAKENYRKTLLSALADVEVSLTAVTRNESRRTELLRAQSMQEKIYGTARSRFRVGDLSAYTLLDEERSLLNQQDQVIQAQGQSLVALVALYKALGGSWLDDKTP